MDNRELIEELRGWAEVEGKGTRAYYLNLAADRLEEMDERISIMAENLDNQVAEFDEMLQEIGVREA